MIEHYEFGKFKIDGKYYSTNIKLINQKVRVCRYFENHEIRLDDFDDIFSAKPDIIIIGTGCYGVIQVPDDIIAAISKKKIKLIILKTKDACDRYNELIKQKKDVAALLHITC